MSQNDDFISRQIAVYKTNKVLLECLDKLNPSSINHYARIHARGEEQDGVKVYSLLCLLAKDYSKGTGDKAVTVKYNIRPEQAIYFLEIIRRNLGVIEDGAFSYSESKIIPDGKKQSAAAYLSFTRTPLTAEGEILDYPWKIKISNGTGVIVKTKTGGSYMKKGSYKEAGAVEVRLNDMDIFCMFSTVTRYIALWESAFAVPVMIDGRNALWERINGIEENIA